MINSLVGRALSFLLLVVVSAACFGFFAACCEAVTVGKIEVQGLYSITKEELFDLMDIREGSPIDEEKIRDGIKRAFLKGIFDDIIVNVSDDEKPVVRIEAREKDRIEKIRLAGDGRLSGKMIKGLFPMKEEQVMRYDLLDTAIEELRKGIVKHGFAEPEISIKIERSKKPCRVDIDLTVEAGEPLLIKSIKFTVVPPYPVLSTPHDKGFAGEMKLSIGDIYDQYKLEKDLKRIKDFFKEEGYYRPVVGPYSYSDGELEIVVNPGRHMTVTIEGNTVISSKKLKKEVSFFEIEDYNDELVEEVVDRILSLYHKEGYPFAQVAPVINSDEHNIAVSFFIFEGAKVRISSIRFVMVNAALPPNRLKDIMSLKEGGIYNADLAEKDRESLKEFYVALGYLEASVKDIEKTINKETNSAEIVVNIDEGSKTEVASVEIIGADASVKDKLVSAVNIKPGDPYNDVDIANARLRIIGYYDEHGEPNRDVIVDRHIEDHKASVIFKVVEGEKKVWGKVIIAGNKKTRYDVIKREFVHKEGQSYNLQGLSEERQRLYKLGIFTDVEIEAVNGQGEKKDMLVKVNESDAGSVEFGLGYAEVEKFRGFVEVGYRNLWGTNRQVSLRSEISSLEKRFLLQYNEPWFMGVALPFRSYLLYEDNRVLNVSNKTIRYRLKRYTMTAGVEKKLSDTLKSELFYDFSLVRTSDVQPDVVLTKEDVGTLAISSIKPSLIYDTRDNPFEPEKGTLASISMKLASAVLFSQTDFAKIIISGSRFYKISKRNVLALAMKSGMAYCYGGTKELPLVERFFLGGRTSVRGYAQDTLGPKGFDGNPIGGNAFFMGNVEMRTALGKGIGIVTFMDYGNVWVKVRDMKFQDLKYTAGLGLRYKTPVGPLSVDYGFKLNRAPGESKGAVHFSIGHAF